jgi:hypothetical protein
MSANNGGGQSIELILQLIVDGRESEALSAIGPEFGPSALEEVRLLPTVIDGKTDVEDPGRRDRVRLTNLYKLSVFLMEDRESWDNAVTALARTIKLSEELKEPFYLEESRFQKALCHKMLGQRIEMLKVKTMVSPHKIFMIGDEDLGIGDLD